jgi:hypothetical protein
MHNDNKKLFALNRNIFSSLSCYFDNNFSTCQVFLILHGSLIWNTLNNIANDS